MSSRPVLVVEHEAQCPPGWMGEWLAAHGCRLDVRRPYAGDRLPRDLTGHGGMLVLGGSMDAMSADRHAWLTDVEALVRHAAAVEVPVLGICLGHQVAAVALGGVVGRNPRGQQMGVLTVGWTDAAHDDALFGALADAPRPAAHWNTDVVTEPPTGTDILAVAPTGELQAARFAPTVWGVQWHPEAGAEIITVWADADRDSVEERDLDVEAYLGVVADARDQLRAAWRPLAESFADLTRERARTW